MLQKQRPCSIILTNIHVVGGIDVESLGKWFLSLIFGIGVYTVFGLIPILKFFAPVFGLLAFLAAGTYLMSQE